MSEEKMLTMKDIKFDLNVCMTTLIKLKTDGDFPAYMKVGGQIRIDPEDYKKWKTQRKAMAR